MKAVLTLKKADLLAKLEARKAEINDHYDGQVAEINEEIARRDDEDQQLTNLADWYQTVAEGLANGSITLTARGSLKDAPAKPGTKTYAGRGGRNPFGWYTAEQLKEQVDIIEQWRQNALREVDTAADLINLSVEDTVQVDAADYQSLLTSRLTTHRY